MIKFRDVLAGCSIGVLGVGMMVYGGNAQAIVGSTHEFPVTEYIDQYEISESYKVCEYNSIDGLTAILIEIGHDCPPTL